MPYSQFTLEGVKKAFELTISDKIDLFSTASEVEYSNYLKETLDYNVPLALAIDSEKARSEMIVCPILIEVRKQLNSQISLFSGIDFNVAPEKGLNGFCDFLISRAPEQLIITAPVLTIVKAKNDNIKSSLGQCIAAMVAAQLFNLREGNDVTAVYGAVTTGTNWKFIKLIGQVVEIDLTEYFLISLGKILGVLLSSVRLSSQETTG